MTDDPRIDLTDPDLFADGPPHDIYRYLRDEAPMFWHDPTPNTPGGEGFWCLTRHEDVAWAARQPHLFSSVSGGTRNGGGTLIEDLPADFAAGVLFNMQDDPRHQCVRRLVTPSVSPRRLRQMEAELAARCAALLDEALDHDPCDFLVEVAAELPLQAIASLLGVPQEDRHFLLDWADATLDYDDHNPGETSARSQEAGAAMSEYCNKLLEQKRSSPADDILSIIATAQLPDDAMPGGPLSDLEQQMFFHLLVAAGSETTRNSITAGLLAVMDQPDEWTALRSDRTLLPGAVEEMLRYVTPVMHFRRTATTDLELHGQEIQEGDKVVFWHTSANRDEAAFEDPDTFDITRSPNNHIAFGGGGPHFCLGANLARMEIMVMFDRLLERIPDMRLDGDVQRLQSNFINGTKHIPIAFAPSAPVGGTPLPARAR